MITTRLTLSGQPPQTFSTDDRLQPPGVIRRPLSGNGTAGENANMTVTLQNGDGLLTALFANPPLRVQAEVTVNDDSVFSGTVTTVTVAEMISLELQA